MPFDEKLANRVREYIALTHENVEEKPMFGGLCFMVNEKMCAAINNNTLRVRVDPSIHEDAIEQEGVESIVFKGKPVIGYLHILEDALTTNKQLHYWLNLALDYNNFAKSTKKKK